MERNSLLAALLTLWSWGALAQGAPDAGLAPEDVPPPPAPPVVRVTLDLGRGVTVSHGEALSMNIRGRVQLRDSLTIVDPAVTNELSLRTARLYVQGKVLSPDLGYFLQLALGATDFEAGISSPVYDAYVEYTGLRDLEVRVGQYLVPFDRARTIRDYALEFVDRAQLLGELGLDRDLGVTLSSQDLFGQGGRITYALGLFSGQGKNRFVPEKPPGFLYTARVAVRPFGAFDEEQEGDLSRQDRPRLAVGAAVAFNQDSNRQRSTTGALYTLGGFDMLHLAADVVFKYRGLSVMAEAMGRTAPVALHEAYVGGVRTQEWSRSCWGYLVQAGYLVTDRLELVLRWNQLRFLGGDPALATFIRQQGRELNAGATFYLNGHLAKVQADWALRFGDVAGPPTHLVRVAVDVSF